MKRLLLIGAIAASLTGCAMDSLTGTGSAIPAPAQLAQHTQADEQAILRAEQAYKLSRTLGEMGVDTGLVHGALAKQLADLDNKLFAALQVARTAYRAFNSPSLLKAAGEVATSADEIQALVKGGKK